ncbi:hypothetical protein D3C80_1807250 [compost metagenome]
MQHAFGFAGAAGGIEDEQRIFSLHRFRRTISTDLRNRLVIPEITPLVPVDRATGAPDHHHRTDVRATAQGLVDVFFQGDGLGPSYPFIRGDDCMAIGVENPVAQGVG